MPELPEVETLKRELDKLLSSLVISEVQVLWPKSVFPLSPISFSKKIVGQKILKLERRAKMLIIRLASEDNIIFHLKMTGQLIFVPKEGRMVSGGHPTSDVQTPGRHTRIIFSLNDGSHLYFNDLRKFGWARLTNENDLKDISAKVGPEPLSKDFDSKFLIDLFHKHPNNTIKKILLDQTLIAGIGNIYADESCFLAHLRPDRKIKTLTDKEVTELQKQIVAVLKLSIKHKGTSSKNYRRSNGELGGFVPYLYVYGRKNQPCKKCGEKILKIKHAGRGTHYCPTCQE